VRSPLHHRVLLAAIAAGTLLAGEAGSSPAVRAGRAASPAPATAGNGPASCLGSCTICLDRYLRAVIDGDEVTALQSWRPRDVALAGRLDVSYTDQPLKIDGDSPIWRCLPALRDSAASYAIEPARRVVEGPLAGTIAGTLAIQQAGHQVRFTYTFLEDRGRWLLASPVRFVADRRTAAKGRYVTVYGQQSGLPAGVASFVIAQLDSCIEAVAVVLDLPADRRELLEREKLGYLFVGPREVELLAGAPTVGVANLQQDLVVTSHPCHAHEMTHLLVNFWLSELPLFTLPLLQEGTAVHLGGRWGRHPRVLAAVGRTSLSTGLVTIDELLTYESFHARSADLTYAPAGVFVGFLLHGHGSPGLRAAYRAVSGTAAEVTGWNEQEVKERLAQAMGTTWQELAAEFQEYLARSALEPLIKPGSSPCPFSAMNGLNGKRLTVLVSPCDAWRVVASEGPPLGAILCGAGPAQPPNALFAEHFPGRVYHGERFGLLFSPEEVKLYDYRRQMLIALHAEGFWPSSDRPERERFQDEDGCSIRFIMPVNLFQDPRCGSWELLDLAGE
jgi:hypothetical protein